MTKIAGPAVKAGAGNQNFRYWGIASPIRLISFDLFVYLASDQDLLRIIN